MKSRRRHLLWFTLGLCSSLQLVASLSITEVVVLLMVPFVATTEIYQMRRTGVKPYLIWALLMVFGAVISYLVYRGPFYFALRRFAVVILIPAAIIFWHWMLRRDMTSLGWYLVGGAISSFLCTFIFQKSVEVSMAGGSTGAAATAAIMNGPLYWLHRITRVVAALYKGWYLQVPTAFSVCSPLALAVFGILGSSSGRGPALGFIGASFIMLVGGKKIRRMKLISKYFVLISLIGFSLIYAFHKTYGYLAREGTLGEKTRKKYLGQTKAGNGMLDLLIGGRTESFVAFYACLDRPILGFGFCPIDKYGYNREFCDKYGSAEDSERYYRIQQENARKGIVSMEDRFIPAHSQIGICWLCYGIFGLLYWIYVIFAILRFLKQDIAVVPQWYGWLAAGVPSLMWNIFFNPLSGRLGVPMFIVACLLARAIRKGRMAMPMSMVRDIQKWSV